MHLEREELLYFQGQGVIFATPEVPLFEDSLWAEFQILYFLHLLFHQMTYFSADNLSSFVISVLIFVFFSVVFFAILLYTSHVQE